MEGIIEDVDFFEGGYSKILYWLNINIYHKTISASSCRI